MKLFVVCCLVVIQLSARAGEQVCGPSPEAVLDLVHKAYVAAPTPKMSFYMVYASSSVRPQVVLLADIPVSPGQPRHVETRNDSYDFEITGDIVWLKDAVRLDGMAVLKDEKNRMAAHVFATHKWLPALQFHTPLNAPLRPGEVRMVDWREDSVVRKTGTQWLTYALIEIYSRDGTLTRDVLPSIKAPAAAASHGESPASAEIK